MHNDMLRELGLVLPSNQDLKQHAGGNKWPRSRHTPDAFDQLEGGRPFCVLLTSFALLSPRVECDVILSRLQ